VDEDLYPNPLVILYADDARRVLRHLESFESLLRGGALTAAHLAQARETAGHDGPQEPAAPLGLAAEVAATSAVLRLQLEQA